MKISKKSLNSILAIIVTVIALVGGENWLRETQFESRAQSYINRIDELQNEVTELRNEIDRLSSENTEAPSTSEAKLFSFSGDESPAIAEVVEIDPDFTTERAIAYEQELINNLCAGTDSCGQMTDQENITLAGKEGIKFTIVYRGRNLGTAEGNVSEYHYSLFDDAHLYRFSSIPVSDLDDQEQFSRQLDEAMSAITFN